MWMDNKRGTAQSTLCVDNKKDKTAKSHVWLTVFLEFHGFRFNSAIPRIPRLFRDRGKSLALGVLYDKNGAAKLTIYLLVFSWICVYFFLYYVLCIGNNCVTKDNVSTYIYTYGPQLMT